MKARFVKLERGTNNYDIILTGDLCRVGDLKFSLLAGCQSVLRLWKYTDQNNLGDTK